MSATTAATYRAAAEIPHKRGSIVNGAGDRTLQSTAGMSWPQTPYGSARASITRVLRNARRSGRACHRPARALGASPQSLPPRSARPHRARKRVLGKLDQRVGLGGREQRLDHVNRFVDATRVPGTPRGMARTRARRTPGPQLLATAQPVAWRRQRRQRRAAAHSTQPVVLGAWCPAKRHSTPSDPPMKRTWPAGHVHNPPGSRRIHKEGGREQACTNMPICRHFLLVDVGPLGWLKRVVWRGRLPRAALVVC
jgi:hypothetical protein